MLRQTPGALDMRLCFSMLFNPFSNARFSLHCIIARCHKHLPPSLSFISVLCPYTYRHMAFIIWNDSASKLPALTGEIFLYASITHVVKVESEGVVNFLDGI